MKRYLKILRSYIKQNTDANHPVCASQMSVEDPTFKNKHLLMSVEQSILANEQGCWESHLSDRTFVCEKNCAINQTTALSIMHAVEQTYGCYL